MTVSDIIHCMNNATYAAPAEAIFTDDRLTSGVIGIRAIHILELRERIDALRMQPACRRLDGPTRR